MLQVVLAGISASQTPVFAQGGVSSGTSGLTETFSFTSDNSAGGLIVVCADSNSATPSMSVSDTQGNVYHSDIGPLVCATAGCGGSQSYQIFYAYNINAGANTITLTDTQNTFHQINVGEWSNVAASAPNAGTGSKIPSVAVDTDSCSFTSSTSGCLVVGFGITDGTQTWTAGAGFTMRNFHFGALESEEGYSGTNVTVPITVIGGVRAILAQAFKPGP